MDAQSVDSLLMQVDKIKQEAYAAGWRDAVAAVNKAIGALVDPAAIENSESQEGVAAHIPLTPPTSTSKLPKQGSTPWEVIQTVKKRPGRTGSQIVETMRAAGHSAPEGSIRTSI